MTSKIFFRSTNSFTTLSMWLRKFHLKILFSITLPLILYLYTIMTNMSSHENRYEIIQKPFYNAPLLKNWSRLYGDGEDVDFEDDDVLGLINTPGCFIPSTVMKFKKSNENVKIKTLCGRRAVFLTKSVVEENKIRATFYKKDLNKLANGLRYICCYYFGQEINNFRNDTKSSTSCNTLYHGKEFTLKSDFVSVQCHTENSKYTSILIYEDVYPFAKKITRNSKRDNCETKYNVLMIGIHSMSLKKSLTILPRTLEHMRENDFFTFRGYNKVQDDTGMILAALTGKYFASIHKKCSWTMDDCNDLMLWSLFKKAGYVTAYGEEGLMLRRNFGGDYAFQRPPTDHYTEPFFSNHERYLSNNSLVCTGKVSSSEQLLEFAHDFAVTYSNDGFFGLFWINSDGFDEQSSSSSILDNALENLLTRLRLGHVTDNTVVVVFSDRGARAGVHRDSVHGFYDERLPTLYLREPTPFGFTYPKRYRNLFRNQYRLTTPYDLHRTIASVAETCAGVPFLDDKEIIGTSLLGNISIERTCVDAHIGDKWCSCYDMKMVALDDDPVAKKAFVLVIQKFNKMVIPTKPGWTCANVTLNGTLSTFTSHGNTPTASTYVFTFRPSPGNKTFEATVVTGDTFRIAGAISLISTYLGEGHCVEKDEDRFYCTCTKIA